MKKIRIVSFILLFATFLTLFAGCEVAENIYSVNLPSGALGSFNLLTPTNNEEVTEVSTFTWSASQNAESYTLEVCSSENFKQTDDKVYIKKTGITTTTYQIGANIKDKNTTYYWRVTAVNTDGKKLNEGGIQSFYYKANTDEEVEIDIDYADEWVVHEQGSNATISIDKSNFFDNAKNSLSIAFVEEDTKQGEGHESSDGWMVITHQFEKEMYGVDAFYFNFYYSGNDADVYIRVVDEDNEYWNAPIKLANNAKQTVIIGFDEFTLRTKGGTTIANQVFDYNYIKYVEIVFEKSFGDGVAMISDLKAVNSEKYSYLFIDEMDFSTVAKEDYIYENYTFDTNVSEDGKTFSYSYSSISGGYGFVKLPIGKHLRSADAISFHVDYTGTSTNGKILFRIIEEDSDRWVYEQNISSIPEDGNLLIPFSAFSLSECNGDGARQFYVIKQFQFGVSNAYGTGTVTISNLRVADCETSIENYQLATMLGDGTIENFDTYNNAVELYYKWQNSTTNKDEQMFLDTTYALGTNNVCGKFTYKSDMGNADYGLVFTGKEGFNALQIYINDKTVRCSEDSTRFNYLGEVSAQMKISIYLNNGQIYHYYIEKLAKDWTNYTIPFTSFELETFYGEQIPFVSENIAGIQFGIWYFYYTEDGKATPVYTSRNPVYIDNIALTTADTYSETLINTKITMDENNICKIDDFENGLAWTNATDFDYSSIVLSDVTATATGNSMKMEYKGSTSVSYALPLSFDSEVRMKGITFSMKGDGIATVYINIYMLHSTGTMYKYRATLTNVSADWTKYTIGFSNFQMVEGTGSISLSAVNSPNITKMTIGIVGATGETSSYVYIDDINMDGNVKYSVNTRVKIGEN